MLLNRLFFLVLFFSLLLVACGNSEVAQVADPNAEQLNLPPGADVDTQTVADIKERDDVFLIDVREQWEYEAGHIPDIYHIPMGAIPERLNEIPKDKVVIVSCTSGIRSDRISNFLMENGYTSVHNHQGGIVAWEEAGLPVEK
jgi:hydroxyacylglutathione hydrolase